MRDDTRFCSAIVTLPLLRNAIAIACSSVSGPGGSVAPGGAGGIAEGTGGSMAGEGMPEGVVGVVVAVAGPAGAVGTAAGAASTGLQRIIASASKRNQRDFGFWIGTECLNAHP